MAIDLTHFSPLGPLGHLTRLPRGVLLTVGEELFKAEVVRADILRLAVSQAQRWDDPPTFATDFSPLEGVPWEVTERGSEIVLETDALRLVVARDELHFDVTRADGTSVLASARDASGRSLAYRVLNDSFAVARAAGAADLVLGLGEKTGPLNRRGRSYTLWNVDVLSADVLEHNGLARGARTLAAESPDFDPYYASIPFFLHAARRGGRLAAAGFFVDNGYLGRFDFEGEDRLAYEFRGGQYVEYVLAGPTLPDAIEAYTFLTGRPRLPPLWALGHQQCRWHDYDDEELRTLAREYRTRGIPCDALWLDIEHMDGFRVFSFHPERHPEPERTLTELREQGFRTVTIVDPGVKREPGNELFERGVRGGHFCLTESGQLYEGRVWPGRTVFPDFSRPETRAFWAELVQAHAERGVAGIWNDMNEPATGAVEPFAMRFDRRGQNYPHERFHNQYALLMALATEAGLVAARPDERPFILSRAGSAGIQRVAAQWLGDHAASFEHLAMGLPMALGLGLSGQPFVGADVPGFTGVATPELAARWFAYAALTPFCRCHHQIDLPEHYPWSFGPGVTEIARTALERRYRLLPYFYATFLCASRTGAPVQRPLLYEFPDDPRAAECEDQFMLGDALLVAPVLAAGVKSRSVYLPPGDWVEWGSDRRLAGGVSLVVPAPLGELPLFGRAGAVVPCWDTAPATTFGHRAESVTLDVLVPAADGVRTSILYEDDGCSLSYRNGASVLTSLELARRGNVLTLRGEVTGAGFADFRRTSLRVRFRGEIPVQTEVEGASARLVDGTVAFPNCGESFSLSAKLR